MKDKFQLESDLTDMVNNAKKVHKAGQVFRQTSLADIEPGPTGRQTDITGAASIIGQSQGPNTARR